MKFFGNIAALALACAGAAYGYARFVEPNILLVKKNVYCTRKLVLNREVKIVQFSDVHIGKCTTIKALEKAVYEINNLDADIVVFTGDMLDNMSEHTVNINRVSSLLKTVKANLGKYAIAGNHEHRHGVMDKYRNMMERGEFTLLINESCACDENITIVGIDDMFCGKGDIVKSFSSVVENTFNIALCHEPDMADEIFQYNADIIFSGHSHWGQVSIPIVGEIVYPPMCTKYPKGEYLINNKPIYTSSGVGTTRLPLRFNAPPSITLYTIKGM